MSDNNNTPQKKDDNGGILSWVGIVVLLKLFPPAGVILLIAKLLGHDLLGKLFGGKKGEVVRQEKPYAATSSSQSRARQNPAPTQAGAAPRQTVTPREVRVVNRISKGKKALFICGLIASILGAYLGVRGLLDWAGGWPLFQNAALTLGGLAMLYTAHSKDKKEQLYQNCVRIVGSRASISLQALGDAAGLKPKKLLAELNEMLERHYFGDSAYIDLANGLLVLDRDKLEEQLRAAQAEAAAKPNREQDRYDLLLQELERACGRITDQAMLEKSVQIRGLTAAIFHAVRQAPEKEAELGSFLNYYFPTTLKLLDSYADITAKGYQGEKLSQTKERIESTADTLIAAFQKQLDHLYFHDALDLDTDIDVLETMLKRDGLADSDFKDIGTPGVSG